MKSKKDLAIIFYLSNSIINNYDNIECKGIHIPEKDVRGLYMTLGADSPITFKLIVSPVLALYNNFQKNGMTDRYRKWIK